MTVRKNLKNLLPNDCVDMALNFLCEFQQVHNAEAKLRLIRQANDAEQLKDYLCEVRFSLLFLKLGFKVEAEPYGDKGPDLLISRDNERAVVECTRFRLVNQGPPEVDAHSDPLELPQYGNIERDTRKSFSKVFGKFTQVGKAKNSFIAIWNDDQDIEGLELEESGKEILRAAQEGNLSIPEGLIGVIYASTEINIREDQRIYFFSLCQSRPPFSDWIKEIEAY